MSKQNKVNPGIYTQRGRLTQDDAARELRKQSAVAPARTSQPMNPNGKRGLAAAADDAREAAPSKGESKGAKAQTATPPRAKKATAVKHTATKPTRKAVLARNAGGPGAALRPTTKRRQS